MSSPVEQAWALVWRFVDGHRRHDELAEALGFRLGAGRGKVLLALREGPRTLTDIADSFGFDAPYTTIVVDKLEAHGLVVRRPHPDDRRRKLVGLTAEGEQAVGLADTILLRPPAALATLSDDELTHLAALLERVVEADRGALDKDGHR